MVSTSKVTNKVNTDAVRKIAKPLAHLQNPEAILPVLLIETGVTTGRTYQAYKRGGKTEGTERFLEQGTSAVIWLFGVKLLNKAFDFIGEKFLKLDGLDIDVGKDALRAPFENAKISKRKPTSIFKFGKIVSSILISTTIMGFVLPKVIQKITKNKLSKEADKNNTNNQNQSVQNQQQNEIKQPSQTENNNVENTKDVKTTGVEAPANNAALNTSAVSMSAFMNNTKKRSLSFGALSANAINGLLRVSHNLENNNTWRLISSDTGVVVGRTANARNKYEGLEFFFRDTTSIYFYMFSTAHFVGLMNKLTKNQKINPLALVEVRDYLTSKLNGEKMDVDDFLAQAIGANKTKISDDFMGTEQVKTLFGKTKTQAKEVMPLKTFLEKMRGNLSSEQIKKANEMSKLQPVGAGGVQLLTRQQMRDVLSDGWLTEPDFLYKTMNAATIDSKATKKAGKIVGYASNPKRFVSMKKLAEVRSSLDDFTQSIGEYAKSKGIEKIDADLINKLAKKNVAKGLAFTVTGTILSVLALAVMIPKIQYAITRKLTGSDAFPGTADYSKEQENKQKLEQKA